MVRRRVAVTVLSLELFCWAAGLLMEGGHWTQSMSPPRGRAVQGSLMIWTRNRVGGREIASATANGFSDGDADGDLAGTRRTGGGHAADGRAGDGVPARYCRSVGVARGRLLRLLRCHALEERRSALYLLVDTLPGTASQPVKLGAPRYLQPTHRYLLRTGAATSPAQPVAAPPTQWPH
ncbi:hypothetical protein BGZ61DRAFT_473642 [Ilyonectria robusta]|uniref:uncharacterized protein n=1 Tax=Ilyonectria robusta TaxID=1079257 RepID=UPI001E8DDB4E|nr:uncharacterized protein BGZ61DRAFT_473642 [Ilyonectria robusta]KAH8734985.1 hypothetical protein BGZ61DRAFT_473642 [Ilyonectria robusta]